MDKITIYLLGFYIYMPIAKLVNLSRAGEFLNMPYFSTNGVMNWKWKAFENDIIMIETELDDDRFLNLSTTR